MQANTKGQIERPEAVEASGLLREEIALLYEECNEKLAEVENDLMDIAEGKGSISPEFVNRVFRAFHSVKGAAAYLLHEPMKTLSHKAESVLGQVREGNIELTATVAELLLTVVSRLKEMADDVDRGPVVDFHTEVEELEAVLKPARPSHVRLNLADQTIEDSAQVSGSGAKPSPSRRLKMLVVEDELTSRLLLQDLLSRYGDCHVAVNGFEAVAAFRTALSNQKGYDLICMDVRMPVMEGTDAVREIRSIEEGQGIYSSKAVKIFMTTSILDIKTIAASFRALCDTYLLKPVDGAQLDEHLRAFRVLAKDN